MASEHSRGQAGVTSELRTEPMVRSEDEGIHPIPLSRQNRPKAPVLEEIAGGTLVSEVALFRWILRRSKNTEGLWGIENKRWKRWKH